MLMMESDHHHHSYEKVCDSMLHIVAFLLTKTNVQRKVKT
jgi:hypothetical protein